MDYYAIVTDKPNKPYFHLFQLKKPPQKRGHRYKDLRHIALLW
jgi:hypothetical protein